MLLRLAIIPFAALLGLSSPLPAAADTRVDEIDALRLAGDYEPAIERTLAELEADPANAVLLNLLGELRLETGALDAAATRFDAARQLPAPNPVQLLATLNRAEVHHQRGELAAAEALWREILAARATRDALGARDLYALAGATRQLGRGDPALFQDAVWLYDQAARKDPALVDAGIALGELLLEKYNNREAQAAFSEVLEVDDDHPRALLGLARSQHFDYSAEAVATTLTALVHNPNLAPARVFLARLFIELEQYEDARNEAMLALSTNPASLPALTLLGVLAHLEQDTGAFDRTEAEVLALNPRYAGFYATLADLAAQNRLYEDAAGFAWQAVELDQQSWRAWGLLGLNRLRLGQMEAGRADLERSFAGDPYNVWIKNTLQLADTFADYVSSEREQFRVVLHGDEDRLLRDQVHALAAAAWRDLARRYDHRPRWQVRIEFYPEHDDFSVRSVGLAGVGLLGVAFGPVVAMDSPAARPLGSFNWGSTLWHELAHVFHLSMTRNRVPRWFTEGLAVHEERRARPGWGADVDPGFLLAYLDGRLLPVSRLNNGFVRPTYDEQVIHSYFQASLVFEFVESRWGFDVIREALAAFRDSPDPDAVLPRLLGLDSAALDAAFDAWLRDRYAAALAALSAPSLPGTPPRPADPNAAVSPDSAQPDKYFDQLKVGQQLLEQGQLEAAEQYLLRAQQLFPEFAGDGSSYQLLARMYLQQERHAEAEAQLAKLVAINGESYGAQLELARLRDRRGAGEAAAAALEAALYIYPYEAEPWADLARLYRARADWPQVARVRRALLALDPVDRAEAHFQLADAYWRAGDRSSAREQILYSLEIAPNYVSAQELLLALVDGTPSSEAQ
ncbi:MAG: tetratricopeptide repeat protein [Gammaproteobacteria bacterium]|nr:tetratricopeptide repeat protein [Gammaproteobacteria bacterium]